MRISPHLPRLCFLLIGLLASAYPQCVSTLAGKAGEAGYTDGPGADARFGHPSGIALDAGGNIYVADYGTRTIRKMTPAGVVSTLAGSAWEAGSTDGSIADARFREPVFLEVDAGGNLYVADQADHTIRKISPTGLVSTLAGKAGVPGSTDGTGVDARFRTPSGIAVDAMGNLYVADRNNHTIRKISPSGVVSTLAGKTGEPGSSDGRGTDARFHGPICVAVDAVGNVYVTEDYNEVIRKISPDGVVSTLAGTDGSVADARFWGSVGVDVDAQGNVYVAHYSANTIRKISPDGVVSTLAGKTGEPGSTDGSTTDARFDGPTDVVVDATGIIYVVDYFNYTIRKILPPLPQPSLGPDRPWCRWTDQSANDPA
ncbi:MAG: NHL repeat-containing protein, partial [Sphingobacteriia bacterium]